MTKKLLAFPLALVLTLCVCSVSVLADGTKTSKPTSAPEIRAASEKGSQPGAKLKKDMEKLVADAKAGKVAPAPQQFPPATRNNLSTAAKIGIVAAIGAGIFLIVMFHQLSKD
jgi:hypothetical protein